MNNTAYIGACSPKTLCWMLLIQHAQQNGFFAPIVHTTRSQCKTSKRDIRQGFGPIHILNHPSNVTVVVCGGDAGPHRILLPPCLRSAVGPRIRSIQCGSRVQASHRHCQYRHHPPHTRTRQYYCEAVLWPCDTSGGPTRPIVPPVQSTRASLPSTTRPSGSAINKKRRKIVMMGCRR